LFENTLERERHSDAGARSGDQQTDRDAVPTDDHRTCIARRREVVRTLTANDKTVVEDDLLHRSHHHLDSGAGRFDPTTGFAGRAADFEYRIANSRRAQVSWADWHQIEV